MKKWLEIPGWFEPDEGDELQRLATNKVCVEVGSFKGRSTACMGPVAKIIHCVDYFRTDLEDGQSQVDHFTVLSEFRKNTEGYPIQVHVGSSLHACQNFEPESVDLVFIDALHTYKAVISDIFSWWDILKQHGIFCFHDYGFGFQGVTDAVKKVFGEVDGQVGSFAWVYKHREDFWRIK